jgi:CRP/FNR family transcriptional regulator, nitrogen oxide reductase regulator
LSENPMGVRQFVTRTPALSGVSAATLDRLVAAARMRDVERGGYLWHAGDEAGALTIIRTGLVKVVKPGPQGRRSICGLFGAPDTVGDAAVLRGIPYPADVVVATVSGSFIEIPRDAVLSAIEKEPQLAMSCARAVQNKLTALLDKIDVLSAGAVEARLAMLLLNLYERFGDELEDDTRIIAVVLTRQELADLVSTTFETTIRVMTRWEREGVVETTPNGFVLRNQAQLEKIVGRGAEA